MGQKEIFLCRDCWW